MTSTPFYAPHTVSDEASRLEVRARHIRERAAQGPPATVEDEATLRRLAKLLAAGRREHERARA